MPIEVDFGFTFTECVYGLLFWLLFKSYGTFADFVTLKRQSVYVFCTLVKSSKSIGFTYARLVRARM